jgi:hypothetical protein
VTAELIFKNGWEITETVWERKTSLLPEAAARIIIATAKIAIPQRTLKYQLLKNLFIGAPHLLSMKSLPLGGRLK